MKRSHSVALILAVVAVTCYITYRIIGKRDPDSKVKKHFDRIRKILACDRT